MREDEHTQRPFSFWASLAAALAAALARVAARKAEVDLGSIRIKSVTFVTKLNFNRNRFVTFL